MPDKPYTAGPYTIQFDGRPWTVATNGRLGVYIRGKRGFRIAPKSVSSGLVGPARLPDRKGTPIDWPAFLEFVGRTSDCRLCAGSWVVEEECACCGEDHQVPCQLCDHADPAWFGDQLLDRRYLRQAAEHLDVPAGSNVTARFGGPETQATIFTEDWRMVLMPMRSSDGYGVGRPEWKP